MSKTAPRTSGAPPIPQLPPPPYQMGLLPDYVRHATPIALRIREHSMPFASDDFTVKDAVTRQRIFEVRGKVLSLSQRKTLHDHTGKPLFEFCSTSGPFSKSYAGYQCGNRRVNLFTVEKIGLLNPKLEITFVNHVAGGRREKLVLRGRWLSRDAEITTQAGVVVAKISREYSFFDRQTYGAVVAPGVDAALITALCVCLDEAYHDGKSRRGGASAGFLGGGAGFSGGC
ncbi:hypothetical protein PaG_01533 [Moesziomyces aphidis]|uniref:DUF567-domain-containing protein n=1 Tax=Moesziomyces aphidis TaxID=84754 RepID=W3VNP9_MOEAP|nr:hypothetical protein PaG_01533 [Moesziomyces aphidis]